ncbi:MAG: hypothetical protein KGL39_33915 [Patescibacteria group bacterium]|nr:hypothetical protein [Patescibacteria group bacterium]
MSNPRDVADYAMKNAELMRRAQENADVSRTFIGLVDRIIAIFGEKANEIEIKGPQGASDGFDVKFILVGD